MAEIFKIWEKRGYFFILSLLLMLMVMYIFCLYYNTFKPFCKWAVKLPSLSVCGSPITFPGCTGPIEDNACLILHHCCFCPNSLLRENGKCWKVCTLPSFLGRGLWDWDFLHTHFIRFMTFLEHWLVGKLQRGPDYWTPNGIPEIDKHDQGFPNLQPANQKMNP